MQHKSYKLLIIIFFIGLNVLTPNSLLAKTLSTTYSPIYQVDLIIFINSNSQPILSQTEKISFLRSKVIKDQNLIILQNNYNNLSEENNNLYNLLPTNLSHLAAAYHKLRKHPQYKVIGNFSWLQPLDNNIAITFPTNLDNGWQIDGSMQIKGEHLYSMAAELFLTPPYSQEPMISFKHNQRLIEGKSYYIDYPQVSMLIKISTPMEH